MGRLGHPSGCRAEGGPARLGLSGRRRAAEETTTDTAPNSAAHPPLWLVCVESSSLLCVQL